MIHVVDISDPQHQQHMAVTDETLKALGADQIPTIYAYNKADLTDLPYPQIEGDNVYLSAKKNSGMAELTALIRSHVFTDYVQCEILVPFDRGNVVSYFNEHAHVQSTSYEETGTRLELECRKSDFEKFRNDFIEL